MNKNILKLPLISLLLILLFVPVTANDFAFFSIVQKIFRSQGLHVDYDHMKFLETSGKRYFILTLESRRTDIDRTMLVSFYATGMAIRQTKQEVTGVSVVLTVSKKDDERVNMSADSKDILNLLDKQISSQQFISSKVMFY